MRRRRPVAPLLALAPAAVAGAVASAVGLLAAPVPARAGDWDGAAWADYRDYLGPIDAATKAHLQAIVADGEAAGRVLGRMGQFGDSITESSAYFRNATLNNVTTNETGHDYAPIRSWLSYSGTQPADANSFYRDHGKGEPYGNRSGWELAEAVDDGHPDDAIEVGNGLTPGNFSWALCMFGTNDIDAGGWNANTWKEAVRDFVQETVALGVVPVLSTIPPELAHIGDGRVQAANAAILAVAAEEDVPWVDYYGLILHFQPVAWVGTLISNDGTHPTSTTGGRGFSQVAQSTTDGYALRTKLAFDAAEKLRAIVFEDGPPDGATSIVSGADTVFAAGLSVFPNPFRGATALRFSVDRSGPAIVSVVDASGRRLRTWDERATSSDELVWDGRDAGGRTVAPGVYFIVLESGAERRVARAVRLR